MTDTYPGAAPAALPHDDEPGRSTPEVARDEALAVKDEAVEGGQRVMETAKEGAGDVVDEAKSQATDLLRQTQDELREQAGVQQQRVADGLKAIGDQLDEMAGGASDGLAADLVARVAARTQGAAAYLDARDPGTLLSDLKRYAARRPGAFIAMAVAAGAVAGRLTRSLAAEHSDAQAESAHAEGGPSERPDTLEPVPAPEQRTPGVQHASFGAADADPVATPLYAELLTETGAESSHAGEGIDPDLSR
ncbi:hypothetical protein [Leifsonia aquatica]|uniref:ElaB/YqjD/DUF883 family membrane-anchored ribosome-binding protein n=3 Tax=Leifsonia aquatica TaxID=144185 RepID=A0A7W4UZ45_LEIAQ|nr:hypothetical protein [Leifsonia aquatica]MBB2968938.1 ElaB/YqjD/DUF883 family membrane-anchored ribosome-binding protein [Leifsonia aquatica]